MEAASRNQRRELASRTQLLAELRGLRVRELRERAAALGIDDRDVERAIDDGCDPRGDLIALIVNARDATQHSWFVAGADTGVRVPSTPEWGSSIGTPESSGSSLFTSCHSQQRSAKRATSSPQRYIRSPLRHGHAAQDAMRVGMKQEQGLGWLPRSEWQTQTVDVERTIMQPMALRHTVPKKHLVPRAYVSPSGTTRVVLEQETYYTTEMRMIDVPVTVVEQEKREVLATVWEPEQRATPLPGTTASQQQAADFSLMRPLSAGQVIDERSMVGAPGSTDWRFQSRAADVSTTSRLRTPSKCPRGNPFISSANHCCPFTVCAHRCLRTHGLHPGLAVNSVSAHSTSSLEWITEQDEILEALQMQRLRGRPALPVGPSALPFGTAPLPDHDADRELVSTPLV